MTKPSKNFDSVETDEAVTETLARNHTTTNPLAPRQPERSGPLSFKPYPGIEQPALSPSDVTDVADPTGVADPIGITKNGTEHVFFEILSSSVNDSIGHATWDGEGSLQYNQQVLDTGDHSAHPYPITVDGTDYLVPARGGTGPGSIEIYEFTTFPTDLSLVETLFDPSFEIGDPIPFQLPDRDGEPWDSSPLTWDGTWYWLLRDNTNTQVRLYTADSFTGASLSEHPSSPLLSNNSSFKWVMGKPVIGVNSIETFYQDASEGGGDYSTNVQISGRRITELSPSAYSDVVPAGVPYISPNRETGGDRWNRRDMHHLDLRLSDGAGRDYALVDGRGLNGSKYSIGIYTPSDTPYVQFGLTQTSDQSVGTSGDFWKDLTFSSITRDTAQAVDLANNAFVAPYSGTYRFGFYGQTSADTTGDQWIGIRFYNATEGAGLGTAQKEYAVIDQQITHSISYTAELDAGDSVNAQIHNDTNNTQATDASLGVDFFGELKELR